MLIMSRRLAPRARRSALVGGARRRGRLRGSDRRCDGRIERCGHDEHEREPARRRPLLLLGPKDGDHDRRGTARLDPHRARRRSRSARAPDLRRRRRRPALVGSSCGRGASGAADGRPLPVLRRPRSLRAASGQWITSAPTPDRPAGAAGASRAASSRGPRRQSRPLQDAMTAISNSRQVARGGTLTRASEDRLPQLFSPR
jgi:hypothetical protein